MASTAKPERDETVPEPPAPFLFKWPIKTVVLPFLGRFALFFGILAAPWPGLSTAEVEAFASVGNVLVQRGSDASPVALRFDRSRAPCPGLAIARDCWNADLVLSSRQLGKSVRLPVDTRALVYLPMVAFLSLALASTLSGKRQAKVVVGGFLVMLAVVSLFSALPLLSILSEAGVLFTGSFLPAAIDLLWQAAVSPGMMFIVPGLVFWALAAVTRETSSASHASVGESSLQSQAPVRD